MTPASMLAAALVAPISLALVLAQPAWAQRTAAPAGTRAPESVGVGPARDVRNGAELPTHPLRQVSPADVEAMLKRAWPTQLSFIASENGQFVSIELPGSRRVLSIDRGRKTVQFHGPEEAVRLWRSLVESLDQPQRDAEQTTEITTLQNAAPSTVQTMLAELRRAARAGGSVRTIAGPNSRPLPAGLASLLFQQPEANEANENQPNANENQPANAGQNNDPNAANQPDQPPAEGTGEGNDEVDAGAIGDVQLEFLPEFGVVIVKGNKRDVARVMRLIEQIQAQATETQPAVEVILLAHINGGAAATLLTELYTAAFADRQSAVSITAIDKPNAVLLVGRQESVDAVKEIIAKLDQPVSPSTQLKIFRLKHMSAIDAEQTVRNFFVANPGQGGNTTQNLRPALGVKVRVIADFRTNSLIVQASPRDMEEVSFLVLRLDVESSDAEHVLRVFKLKNSLAPDLATVLQQAISGLPANQQGVPQATTAASTGPTQPATSQRAASLGLSIVGVDPANNRLVQAGILNDVTVTADANVNALLVRGPARAMDLMQALIDELDKLPDAQSQIKVFELENGDAVAMTALLQQLFGLQVTAGQGTLNQFTQALSLANLNPGAGGAGDSSLIPLRFSYDQRTNTIIASGGAGDLQVVELLILRLDESGVEPRTTKVVRLKNAPALDVATAITNYLNTQRTITANTALLTGVSLAEQAEQEVIVVPELVTNSLIVSASPRYFDKIMDVINDLDFRPAMIMVQVLIAEVTLSDDFEHGVELGFQDSLLFDRGIAGAAFPIGPEDASNPGFLFNNGTPPPNLANSNSFARSTVGAQSLTNFALGRASATAGFGGLILSGASDSINYLIRSMQNSGRLQILSRPQVMTLDNEPAFVQVGQRVARITGSSTNAQAGGTSNSTADVDVGLLLRIQPRVNTDGVVVMTLDAERSVVGDPADGTPVAVTPGGQAVNSPPINTTTAQTTVSARSGQTIVFAGLIQKQKTVLSRRVPYVSDIPILGQLFRFDAESESRNELLIIMTPHVVTDDEQIAWLNATESDRMSWCLADVVEMHGYVDTLSGGHGLWGPPTAPTIYPDLTPTIDGMPYDGSIDGLPPGAIINSVSPGEVIYAEPIQGAGPNLAPTPSSRPPTPPAASPPGFNDAQPSPDSAIRNPTNDRSSRRMTPLTNPTKQAGYYATGSAPSVDPAAHVAPMQTPLPQRLPMPR